MTTHDRFRIERARPADAGGLARVYVETWRAAYAGLVPDRVLVSMKESVHEARFARWIGQQTDRQFILVCRVPDRGVVGLCSAGPARGGPKAQGEIYLLYVDQDWQNRGIGRSLLRAALRGLRAGGYSRAAVGAVRQPVALLLRGGRRDASSRTDRTAVGHGPEGNQLYLA